jgi:hypothetical protein
MDAYHVLLGILWMLDRKVFHDGRENSYEFFKDGQCYKLFPMLEKNMDNSRNKGMENSTKKFMDNSNNKGIDKSNNKVMESSSNKNMHKNNSRIILCSTNEFLREKKHNGCYLAIIPKRIQETEKKEFYISRDSTLIEII